ncbi:uncharacterized protein (TIGR03089 family) [Kineosphaera limosa]|uniref:TIGR03089 family protein n=1 Tax=Kineosphaera limosa NBRC 100340 TaxID=1184609 RepID=K6WDQ9_9MICO|nr:TIGR03089 family protein [Kineosphaera limosa]NYE02567.1 uncharacterized protein (TIGR03089 family) [Kineosphaera limosa]GAB97420.1 hypothetical protein KILIM_067_00210 [Kineosphaera limosa NBRC 100340]
MTSATTLPELLETLASGPAATAPRLTHYDGAERIELSGKVLSNWVAKAANLLIEEADAAPGTKVRLDLPAGHWRAAYWALATWAVGATLCLRGSGQEADVVVTDSPQSLGRDARPLVVGVTLQALSRSFPGALDSAALDEAAILATYGDHLDVDEEPDPADPAVMAGGQVTTFEDLVGATTARPERVLLLAPHDQALALQAALTAWSGGGSVVVVRAQPGAQGSSAVVDGAVTERLVATEQITRIVAAD